MDDREVGRGRGGEGDYIAVLEDQAGGGGDEGGKEGDSNRLRDTIYRGREGGSERGRERGKWVILLRWRSRWVGGGGGKEEEGERTYQGTQYRKAGGEEGGTGRK